MVKRVLTVQEIVGLVEIYAEMAHVVPLKPAVHVQMIVERAHQLALQLTNMDLWKGVNAFLKSLAQLENADASTENIYIQKENMQILSAILLQTNGK